MGTLKLHYEDLPTISGVHIAVSHQDFKRFSSEILGLGNIQNQGSSGKDKFDALAVVFDLEGFTSFFDRRDPQLVVPKFLDKFLYWLFEELKEEFHKRTDDNKVLLWAYLPVFAKFMGDGVLLLWQLPKDDNHGGGLAIGNIVVRLHRITKSYKDKFLCQISKDFITPPKTLRCGGAVGQVFSIGNNEDFVGACINLASRLQKIGGLSFAFARDGCDPDLCFKGEFKDTYITKTIDVRGFAKGEKILVDKYEFAALPVKSQKEFQN